MRAMVTAGAIGAVAACAWLAFACVCRALDGAYSGEPLRDMAWGLVQVYVRVVHRVRYEGREHVPRWRVGDPPVGKRPFEGHRSVIEWASFSVRGQRGTSQETGKMISIKSPRCPQTVAGTARVITGGRN